jgi:hypothetical protein
MPRIHTNESSDECDPCSNLPKSWDHLGALQRRAQISQIGASANNAKAGVTPAINGDSSTRTDGEITLTECRHSCEFVLFVVMVFYNVGVSHAIR